ncbi:MAG: tryptophan--tRNA ligase [Saprospiraceae bacterium]
MSDKKNVLSCIQPTGDIHLGNYLGAVKNWVDLQEKYNCTYGVVDYHAMTMPYKAKDLRQNTWKMVFQLLACGVKTENLFIQSLVPEHSELGWILGNVCSFGELSKMTQFKDKKEQVKDSSKDAFISTGLFNYPVLQAADILIYHADFVPVGKDQIQHLELSRNIAHRFNTQFGKEYFAHPEPLLTENAKIMSLANPEKKMSKSLGEKHYVNIFGDEARIRKQVKSAVTDTGNEEGDGMSPGITNLFGLLKASGRMDVHTQLMEDHNKGELKYSALKGEVAEGLVALCSPIRERYEEIYANRKEVKYQIQKSSGEIRKRAVQTLKEVKELVGIMNPKF